MNEEKFLKRQWLLCIEKGIPNRKGMHIPQEHVLNKSKKKFVVYALYMNIFVNFNSAKNLRQFCE